MRPRTLSTVPALLVGLSLLFLTSSSPVAAQPAVGFVNPDSSGYCGIDPGPGSECVDIEFVQGNIVPRVRCLQMMGGAVFKEYNAPGEKGAAATLCSTELCILDPTGLANCGDEICDDGLDNDGDGQIDCQQQSCHAHPNCKLKPENCTNGIDDNENGQIDCDDQVCQADPSCVGFCCVVPQLGGAGNCPKALQWSKTCLQGGGRYFSNDMPGAFDACNNFCSQAQAVCGDSKVEKGEQCDNGPKNSDTAPDACRTNCREPSCGDVVVDIGQGEECDRFLPTGDRNTNCTWDCESINKNCGDSIVDPGEECDDGWASNSDTTPNACRESCTNPRCGDGVVDAFEECDKAGMNGEPGSNCSDVCTSVPMCNGPTDVHCCGDAVVDAWEECDDGWASNSNDDPDACRVDCREPVCGDEVVDSGEECDDGDPDSPDGNGTANSDCNRDCEIVKHCGDPGEPDCCGNGEVDTDNNEQCDDWDDANEETMNSNDANAHCREDCQLASCDDEIIDDAPAGGRNAEECDKGLDNGEDWSYCDQYCAMIDDCDVCVLVDDQNVCDDLLSCMWENGDCVEETGDADGDGVEECPVTDLCGDGIDNNSIDDITGEPTDPCDCGNQDYYDENNDVAPGCTDINGATDPDGKIILCTDTCQYDDACKACEFLNQSDCGSPDYQDYCQKQTKCVPDLVLQSPLASSLLAGKGDLAGACPAGQHQEFDSCEPKATCQDKCGNGIIDGNQESCDCGPNGICVVDEDVNNDGEIDELDQIDADACEAAKCKLYSCGNGVLDHGEECDDGRFIDIDLDGNNDGGPVYNGGWHEDGSGNWEYFSRACDDKCQVYSGACYHPTEDDKNANGAFEERFEDCRVFNCEDYLVRFSFAVVTNNTVGADGKTMGERVCSYDCEQSARNCAAGNGPVEALSIADWTLANMPGGAPSEWFRDQCVQLGNCTVDLDAFTDRCQPVDSCQQKTLRCSTCEQCDAVFGSECNQSTCEGNSNGSCVWEIKIDPKTKAVLDEGCYADVAECGITTGYAYCIAAVNETDDYDAENITCETEDGSDSGKGSCCFREDTKDTSGGSICSQHYKMGQATCEQELTGHDPCEACSTECTGIFCTRSKCEVDLGKLGPDGSGFCEYIPGSGIFSVFGLDGECQPSVDHCPNVYYAPDVDGGCDLISSCINGCFDPNSQGLADCNSFVKELSEPAIQGGGGKQDGGQGQGPSMGGGQDGGSMLDGGQGGGQDGGSMFDNGQGRGNDGAGT